MTKPAHGLWIDDNAHLIASDAYWQKFRRLGFSVAALFLDSFTPGFDMRYDEAELRALGERLRKLDIEIVITVVPEPRRAYLAQMKAKLPHLLTVVGAAALEFDTESNWTPRKVDGYASLTEAATDLDATVDVFKKDIDVRTELTTFTEHGENGPRATLADDVDRTVNQGYSVRKRKGPDGGELLIPWTGHMYSPRAMQKRTFDRAMQIPKRNGKPAISCGLAAYDQSWPGHTVEEAMRVAYETALEYEPMEVRWWSSKWVIGSMAQRPVAAFFEGLQAPA